MNWVYFGQIIVKSTQFDPNWVLFFRKWYTDGWEIWQKIGIEIVRFSRSGRHIHVRFWWKNPPPGELQMNNLQLFKLDKIPGKRRFSNLSISGENHIRCLVFKLSGCESLNVLLLWKHTVRAWTCFHHRYCAISNYGFLVVWFDLAMVLSVVWPRIYCCVLFIRNW